MSAPEPPVGVKKLNKWDRLQVRFDNRSEERRQFFWDVYIPEWGWDPRFYNLDGILRGKPVSSWKLRRYVTLGWVRLIADSPGYELTPNGEEVFRDEYDEVEDEQAWPDDYDDEWDDLDEDDYD